MPFPQNVRQRTQENLYIVLHRMPHPLFQLEVILFTQLGLGLYSFLLVIEELLHSFLLGLRSRGLLWMLVSGLRYWAKVDVVEIIHEATQNICWLLTWTSWSC